MSDSSTISLGDDEGPAGATPEDPLALVVAWSGVEPARVGEVALLGPAGTSWRLGRGASEGADWVRFARQRPFALEPVGPVEGPAISREQLHVQVRPDALLITRSGRTTTATGNTAASTGGTTSTGATASSTGATTSSTTGAGGAPDCGAFFATPGPCGLCTEQKCCSELTACKGSQDCLDCMMGVKDVKTDPACKAAPTKALLDAVDTCDNTQCTNACLNPDMDTAACDAKTTQVGACATDTAKFPCNPITNAGCKAGEQCDYAIGMGADDTFVCFPLDPMPTSVCEDCSMHFCGAGLTCIGTCARYCCDNTDCGTGICSKTTAQVDKPGMGAVGICVAKP